MKLFIILLFTSLSGYLLAAPPLATVPENECSNSDIRDTNPRIRDNPQMREYFSNPRDQDSIGWCYAFVATDLMTAELGTPVSALHASILYNHRTYSDSGRRRREEQKRRENPQNNQFNEVYEGGWPDETVDTIRRNRWICTEQGLPFDTQQSQSIYDVVRDLEALKANSSSLGLTQDNMCLEITNIVAPYNLLASEVEAMSQALLNQNMNLTMEIFANNACTQRITNIPKYKFTERRKPRPTDNNGVRRYMNEINSALNIGKPVSFDYYTNSFSISQGYHASVIIGRRWNNGRCEYNVRNSWGTGCGQYLSHIDCNSAEGTFWISDADFFDSSTHLRYIRN